MPETQRANGSNVGRGDDGSGEALEATSRVSEFMDFHTGRPHVELVREIVAAYYPDASDRDRGRTLRARKGKTPQ